VRLTDSAAPILTISRTCGGAVTGAAELGFNQAYRSALNAGSAELQHLLLGGAHTLIVGGRYQGGTTDNTSRISRDPTLFPPALLPAPVVQMNSVDLERLSLYAYEQWQIAPPLRLIAGISYDRLVFPENIDLPPLSGGERTKSQVSPKAGFIWSPTDATTVRGAYARSLGGVYYDTSVRLEPTQVAGFVQAFRSVIPESVTGLVPGSEMETFGLTVEQRFPTRTYVGLEGQVLASEADRSRGVFNFVASPATPGTVRETLEFTELTLALTAHQFVRDNWVMGARYQLSDARLDDRLPEVPAAFYAPAQTHVESTLHHLTAYLRWHHPSGLFAQTDAAWYRQSNRGFPVARPGDDFWHFNAFAGYRFPRRRAEVRVGLLNLTGQDYRLEPLNLHADLPRERTVAVSLKVDF
jgi:outer membrane receptor protein involved in Fe transport